MKALLATLTFSLLVLWAAAQPAKIAILLAEKPQPADRQAAQVLQFYLKKITGAEVPLLTGGKTPFDSKAIYIGKHPELKKAGMQLPVVLPEDAFFIQSNRERALIAGGGEMGSEYGVYTFLETIGCRKYSVLDSFIPSLPQLQLPLIAARLEKPAFPYRELWYEPAFNESWARWHKLKTNPKKNEEWGLFVHTFQTLCPAQRYFDSHPEYFAWNGKQYLPGQLCLSNDTVRHLVIEQLQAKIKEKPLARYWSVSQNDNYDYCKCARCAASDRRYGSPAGTLLAFVNQVAAAFPDKTISTLAYQYTRKAPTGIRPADNVSVCLCSIECNRGLPLAEDAGSTDFVKDVEEWSALSQHLMIWDYVVQFRDYLSPFPNWHTLQPNLQFFQKNKVQLIFEQGSGHDRSEFSDMRAYLLAKLMWNPQANQDSILNDFGKGYYQVLQPFVRAYIDSLTTHLLQTDHQLQIYGTPLTPSKTWMTDKLLNGYFDIFNEAMGAVEDPSPMADRLSEVLLPLVHSMLEQFKIRDWGNPCPDSLRPGKQKFCYLPVYYKMAREFPGLCRQFGYRTMNENRYFPEQYASDVLRYFEEGRVWHAFMRRPSSKRPVRVRLGAAASPNYEAGRPEVLIDSRRGTEDYRFNWLGFEGKDLDLELRQPDSLSGAGLPLVSSVSLQFLQDQASWVFFPEKVSIEVSEDGQVFQKIKEIEIPLLQNDKKAIQRVQADLPQPLRLKAVRVQAVNTKTCPPWHACSGNPCWIFVDEVVVD